VDDGRRAKEKRRAEPRPSYYSSATLTNSKEERKRERERDKKKV